MFFKHEGTDLIAELELERHVVLADHADAFIFVRTG